MKRRGFLQSLLGGLGLAATGHRIKAEEPHKDAVLPPGIEKIEVSAEDMSETIVKIAGWPAIAWKVQEGPYQTAISGTTYYKGVKYREAVYYNAVLTKKRAKNVVENMLRERIEHTAARSMPVRGDQPLMGGEEELRL